MMKLSATLAAFALLSALVSGQSIGSPINVLFPSNNNLLPADQELVVAEDGSFVAGIGSLPTVGDVLIVDMGSNGTPVLGTNVLFPGSNDVSASNKFLVASRNANFLVCYGSNGSVGDLVFIAKNSSGTWIATNVLFPSGNGVPTVGTRPVISDDESFILCRGLSATAEFVIIPVLSAGGVFSPGTPFSEAAPGGNTIPLSAIDPVIAPNSRSFAVTTSNSALGDLMIGTVGVPPVSAANTTIANVFLPSNNNLLSTLTPPVASPKSNYWVVYGQATIGDLAVIAMSAAGVVGTMTNVLFPSNNNLGYASVPPPRPSVSVDGRLIAVNGLDTVNGDVVLVPVDIAGTPGAAANVVFPASNNVANLQLPPVVSVDGTLVVHRGSATIGDLVVMDVTYSSPTMISGTIQNVLYPNNNSVPSVDAHVALSPDRSYAVTLGSGTIGDIVITRIDVAGMVTLSPINVLYPSNNNVANLGTTPRISREGNLILTSGSTTIGDAVVTGVAIDYSNGGQVANTFTANVLYPASNNNAPLTREPVFSSTTQFVVSAGTSTIGDLVIVPLLDPFPRFLARADSGTIVPVRIFSPPDAGKFVFIAAAAGRNLGQTLPDTRIVPLNNDFVFQLSLMNPSAVFSGYGMIVGPLDANGVFDGASVTIPAVGGFEGIYFYTAFAVLDAAAPLGIGTISDPSILVVE
jgi:hypothetical protein